MAWCAFPGGCSFCRSSAAIERPRKGDCCAGRIPPGGGSWPGREPAPSSPRMTGMPLGSRAVPDTSHDEAVPLSLPLLRERFDPDPDLRRLRDARPVARLDVPDDVPPVWLVTAYDEVRRVLGDPGGVSHDPPPPPRAGPGAPAG